MLERFHTYLTAERLAHPEFQVWRGLSDREKRSRITIGVIDDNEFQPKQNLEHLGYRIEFLGNPNSVNAVRGSQIVLCDLQGVGRAIDPVKQGAFFIKEIRANFPEKYVIAYTGGGLNQSVTREALIAADAFIKKDAITEEWKDKLDPFVQDLLDPAVVWQRARQALVSRRVDTLSILQLEDAFVQSVMNRQPERGSTFNRQMERLAIDGKDVRAVVQSIVASGLYALLTGGGGS